MRRTDQVPFRVHTASSAWLDLGRVTSQAHLRIFAALQDIAQAASKVPDRPTVGEELERLHTVVEGYRVEYELSEQTRTITLTAVRPG